MKLVYSLQLIVDNSQLNNFTSPYHALFHSSQITDHPKKQFNIFTPSLPLKHRDNWVVVGDVGFDAFVCKGFEIFVEKNIVDAEGREIAVVGGAEAVAFLAESVGVVFYQSAVGV